MKRIRRADQLSVNPKIRFPPRPDPTPMLRQASTIAYYTLLEALRNRLI